jgi:surface antigen
VLNENTPDSSDGLSATGAATPPISVIPVVVSADSVLSEVPVQYTSRREMRIAAEKERTAPRAPKQTRVTPATASASESVAVEPVAPADSRPSRRSVPNIPQAPESVRAVAAVPTAKPNRQQRAAERRLSAAEPTRRVVAGAAPFKKKQSPVVVLFTLLIVPGFLASASLPAYAFAPAGAEHAAELEQHVAEVDAATLPSQEYVVDSSVASAELSRDAIGATSEEELAKQKAAQLAAAALASYQANAARAASGASGTSGTNGTLSGTVTGNRAAGDDYPWPGASDTLSPLNYYYRQCVDFVAWRLNRDAGSTSAPFKYVWSNLTPGGGNASEWKRAWESKGWVTSDTPVIGAVAWFNGNHVAYVKEIVGSNVVIEEYNGMAKRAYAMRTIPASSVAKFLYPPPR